MEEKIGCGCRYVAVRRASVEAGTESRSPREEESSLPLVQRCKNLLAANWRAQITTINANDEGPDAPKVHGSLVNYILVGGNPLLWIPKNDAHELNLVLDERGSLVVGHTDPPPLVRAWREIGRVPPRVMLLGSVAPLQRHELDYVKRRVAKVHFAVSDAVKEAGAALQSVLHESGTLVNSRAQALEAMVKTTDAEYSIFSMAPKSCHFVDVLGGRHEVDAADIAGAAVDPLCRVLLALIDGINKSETRRFALIVFCAVYLQVRVQDAYIFAADRWGFNVLANVMPKEDSDAVDSNKLWREFRFGFAREVKDAEGFCVLLAEMEKESLDALKKAQEVDPDFLKRNVPK